MTRKINVRNYQRFKNGKWENVTEHFRNIDDVTLSNAVLDDIRTGKAIQLETEPIISDTIMLQTEMPGYLMDNLARMWEAGDPNKVKLELSQIYGIPYELVDEHSAEIDQCFRDWNGVDPESGRVSLRTMMKNQMTLNTGMKNLVKIEEAKSSDKTMGDVMEENMNNPNFIIDNYTIDTYWDELSLKERSELLEILDIGEDDINDEIGNKMDTLEDLGDSYEEKFEKNYPIKDLDNVLEDIEIINTEINELQGKRIEIKKNLKKEWDNLDDSLVEKITWNVDGVNKYHQKRCKNIKS